jgi:anti-sigma regulatory factor (Ser/Thr protein kinase)/GNAT superfamily N-acetyltransferase
MRTTPHTQLRVPAEGRFLVLVQGHVRDVARIAGFPAKDVLTLELAAEEAFQNICAHAYPDGTPGDMLVKGELLEGELRLEFIDEGLPFDPALLHRQPRRAESEVVGLGMKLIHHAVDEVRWVNRGRQGKALCLVKQLPRDDRPGGGSDTLIAQPAAHLDTEAQADHAAGRSRASQSSGASEVSEAHGQPIEIRPLQPEEALDVARLFWLTYGYSYKNEAFYRPEGLLDLVARGVLASYVGVTSDGEVVGHAGLLRPEPVPMAEMALLVVSPAYRGRGLMKQFFSALSNRAREMGLFGLALNPVTSHPISQRNVINMGGRPCGLDLAACPPRQFKAMGLEDGPGHRESYLHCFLYLTDTPSALAFIPERHRRITERIYEKLERPLIPVSAPATAKDAVEADQGSGERASGVYTVSFDRGLLKGVVRVSTADARQWPEILRAGTDLLDIAGAEVVHIDLPLAQRATALLCELAEAAGFFFAGVWPHAAEDGDMLRLSRPAAPLDMNLLRLHSDFAHELAEYVGAEMKRAATIYDPHRRALEH